VNVPADFVAMVGEYVGTTLFLLLALGGTNVANIPNNSVTGVTTEGQDGTAAAAVNVITRSAIGPGSHAALLTWCTFGP
jgi:aquaporin related protein